SSKSLVSESATFRVLLILRYVETLSIHFLGISRYAEVLLDFTGMFSRNPSLYWNSVGFPSTPECCLFDFLRSLSMSECCPFDFSKSLSTPECCPFDFSRSFSLHRNDVTIKFEHSGQGCAPRNSLLISLNLEVYLSSHASVDPRPILQGESLQVCVVGLSVGSDPSASALPVLYLLAGPLTPVGSVMESLEAPDRPRGPTSAKELHNTLTEDE
ncbi:hypothetical protein Taro_011292, partial [Colocasia esculenta]|nr:hypothetical protein [Colocasia esculenta]